MFTKLLLVSIWVALCTTHTVPAYPYYFEDLEPSPSEHQYKQGAGKQYQASQFSSEGEKGEKGYRGHHEAQKGAKGHHDKENQQKHYAEEGGNKKGYNHKDGYYAEQHKGEKGAKGYEYADKGSYAKGHSTKGHHNVHKLNEFKKKKEFYDQDHDEAFKENHGGFEVAKGAQAGAQNSGGHFKKVYHEGDYAKGGKYAKGSHYFDDAGHRRAQGHDGHYAHGAEFAKKGGEDGFKEYGHSEYAKH